MSQDSQAAQTLDAGLRQLHLPVNQGAREKLLRFARTVLEANQRTNLTGAKSVDELVTTHLLDSLAPLAMVEAKGPVVDVGPGAGFPGIPGAIVFPQLRFTLLEPRRKRAEFLKTAICELGIPNAIVEQKSSGSASSTRLRAAAGTVLMRAVASPHKSLQLGLPLVRKGGMLLLYEGRAARCGPEDVAIAHKFDASIQVKPVRVPFLKAQRHVWIVRRTGTPRRLQRFT